VIERHHQVAALAIPVYRGAVHRDNVELSIVVAIDESNPAAHRFNDGFLVGSRDVRNIQSCRLRNILELHFGSARFRRLRIGAAQQRTQQQRSHE